MRELLPRFFEFLNRRERVRLAGVLTLIFLGALFESAAVMLIGPLVLAAASGSVEDESFLAFGLAFAGIAVLKNLLLAGASFAQFRFLYGVQARAAEQLLGEYLRRDYRFHLARNPSAVLRNITQDVGITFGNVLIPLAIASVETGVALAVASVLLVIYPVPTLVVGGTLALSVLAFQRLVTRVVQWSGKSAQEASGLMIHWVTQSLASIKESKVLGIEQFFVSNFATHAQRYADAMRTARFLADTPRLAIETAGVLCFVVFALVAFRLEPDPSKVIAMLAMFGFAGVRLMPAANRVATSVTSIRHYLPSFRSVFTELSASYPALPPDTSSLPRFATAIELSDVSFSYSGDAVRAVESVSLRIKKGQSLGLVGRSGAGKSTLLDLILGLLEPTSGSIAVDGIPLRSATRAWRSMVGYIPQPSFLATDTVRSNVALGVASSEIDDTAVRRALQTAGCEAFVSQLPDGINTFIGENGSRLSGGQRQRLGIARALYRDPAVLILDEATSALDPQTESEFRAALNSAMKGRTVITVSHRLASVRNCDVIAVLREGRLVGVGSFEELTKESSDFREMLRED